MEILERTFLCALRDRPAKDPMKGREKVKRKEKNEGERVCGSVGAPGHELAIFKSRRKKRRKHIFFSRVARKGRIGVRFSPHAFPHVDRIVLPSFPGQQLILSRRLFHLLSFRYRKDSFGTVL